MIRYKIAFVIVIFLTACSGENDLPEGIKADPFKYENRSKQSLLIVRMTDEDIPYKVNEKGYVVYMQRDYAAIKRLQRQIEYGDNLSANVIESEFILDEDYRRLLDAELSSRAVPYTIANHEGLEHFQWIQVYAPKADLAVQAARLAYYENATNK